MGFLVKVAGLVRKDLLSELRTKEMISSMLIFAFLVIVIFAFAFEPSKATTKAVFPGIIWVGFSFAGILGLGRSFTAERENDCLLGLMLAPVDRSAIYFGKVISNFFLVTLMQVVSLPVFFVLFDYRVTAGGIGKLVIIMVMATFGFMAVGTLLAALSANARTSEILLPLILFPIIVPVVIAAVKLTAMALAGSSWGEMGMWLRMLVVYDVLFLVIPFMLFDFVLEV